MSKAFTKEDAEPDPLVVPRRAPLPAGTANYVTARGLAALRAELEQLERSRAEGAPDSELGALEAFKLGSAQAVELSDRVASAQVVDPRAQPHDEVRFGAHVTLLTESGAERRYQIVGVDEADVGRGRLAFVAPLARALLGKQIGDVVVHRAPRGAEELEVLAIRYEDA